MLESIPSPVPVVASNALYEIADAWLAQLDDRVRAGEISQATRDNYAQGFQRFAAFADRTPITGTLVLNWIAAQNFATTPALNGIFIESNTPINRVKAVLTEPDFLWDGWFNLITARPMPTYSVPGLVDHF